MDLRPRLRQSFSGFTKAEVQKLERLHSDFKEQTLKDEFCKKLARLFNRSSGRAGKPAVKWTEIQSWFQKNQQHGREVSSDRANDLHIVPETVTRIKENGDPKMPEREDDLEFEARSSKDGAWYDVDTFLSHRYPSSGETQLLVRFVGFGVEEDEWVDVRDSVRVRSVALDHTECQNVKVGDLVVCFQEKQDQARYYDAHVLEIQRRWHDIRGKGPFEEIMLPAYLGGKVEAKIAPRRCPPDFTCLASKV